MASTGEVACFGDSRYEAFLKAMVSAKFKVPKNKNALISIGPLKDKVGFLESCTLLQELGFSLFATQGTHLFLKQNDIYTTLLNKPSQRNKPQALQYIST